MTRINGVDISSYNIHIARGGLDDFFLLPERDKVEINNWHECDGIEVDLESPIWVSPRKIMITYHLLGGNADQFVANLNSFRMLHEPRIILFQDDAYKISVELEPIAFSDYRHKGGLEYRAPKTATIAVEYLLHRVEQLYNSDGSCQATSYPTYVSIDNIDLSSYGMIVHEVYSSALLPLSYKGGNLRKDTAKIIQIDCSVVASSMSDIWCSLSHIFSLISQEHTLTIRLKDISYQCYYLKSESAKVTHFQYNSVVVSLKLFFQTL